MSLKAYPLIAFCFAVLQTISFYSSAQNKTVIYAAKKIISEDSVNTIYTNNPAVAVDSKSGTILKVGNLDSLKNQFPNNSVVQTFSNNILMPGFVEAHSHFQIYGMYSNLPYTGYYTRPGLTDSQMGITSSTAMIQYLKSVLDTLNKDRKHLLPVMQLPLFASGADPIYFNGTRFTSATLDSVSNTTPILMQLGSGHIVICNTPMLSILESDTGWKNLPAQGIIRDHQNNPTGELDEVAAEEFALSKFNSIYLTRSGAMFFNPIRLYNGITNAATLMNRAGITTATEMIVTANNLTEFLASRAIYNSAIGDGNNFPVRLVLAYDGMQLLNVCSDKDSSIRFLNAQKKLDNNSLRTGMVKFVLDGSIQGYTAVIDSSMKYLSQPQNPYWNTAPTQLASLMLPFVQNGYPVAIHANGDSALDVAINALSSINAQKTATGIWATLQHGQMIKAAQFPVIQQMQNVGLNLFVSHIYYYGSEHASYTVGKNWVDSMDNVHVADSLQIPFSIHSDAPVTSALPLLSAWVATKRTSAPYPAGQYSSTQFGDTITTAKALYAITMGGAKLLNMDTEVGSIEPLKFADFAILQNDPYNLPTPMQLKDIPIVGTIKGGVFYPASATANQTKTHKKKKS